MTNDIQPNSGGEEPIKQELAAPSQTDGGNYSKLHADAYHAPHANQEWLKHFHEQKAAPFETDTDGKYVVKEGDTLETITRRDLKAAQNDDSKPQATNKEVLQREQQIKSANAAVDWKRLPIGTKLNIPDHDKAAADKAAADKAAADKAAADKAAADKAAADKAAADKAAADKAAADKAAADKAAADKPAPEKTPEKSVTLPSADDIKNHPGDSSDIVLGQFLDRAKSGGSANLLPQEKQALMDSIKAADEGKSSPTPSIFEKEGTRLNLIKAYIAADNRAEFKTETVDAIKQLQAMVPYYLKNQGIDSGTLEAAGIKPSDVGLKSTEETKVQEAWKIAAEHLPARNRIRLLEEAQNTLKDNELSPGDKLTKLRSTVSDADDEVKAGIAEPISQLWTRDLLVQALIAPSIGQSETQNRVANTEEARNVVTSMVQIGKSIHEDVLSDPNWTKFQTMVHERLGIELPKPDK